MEKKLENISKLADDIVLTEQNERKQMCIRDMDIAAQIREVYGNKIHIFANCIPMSVRAAETTAEGKSIYLHDPKGIVAEGYHLSLIHICFASYAEKNY